MSTCGLSIGVIKGLNYNVCNIPVQPLHYISAQSRGHYELLVFTNIAMPNPSSDDTCPLPKELVVALHRDTISSEMWPLVAMGPPAALPQPDLCHLPVPSLQASIRLVPSRPSSSYLKPDPNLHGLG
jgi:hypothetical protein